MTHVLRRIRPMDLVILAVFVAAAMIALGYGPRARMVPLLVAVGSAAFVSLQMALDLRGVSVGVAQEEILGEDTLRAAEEAEAKEEAFAAAAPPPSVINYAGGSLLGGLALIVGYAALILGLGFVPAVFLFVSLFLLAIARLPPLKALFAAVVTEAVTYGLFVATLGVRPNTGYLFELFR